MDFFPAFLNIREKDCLVVGGGSVAHRKIELLQRAGARVTVVAPQIETAIRDLDPSPVCLEEIFEARHLDGMTLAIVATPLRELNKTIAQIAMSRNIPVNVVDDPDLCSFIVPSIVDRDPMIVAVSSSGAAPILSRLTRTRIEAVLPIALGALASLARKYRQSVKDRFATAIERRRFWEGIFEGEVADRVYAGRLEDGERLLEEKLVEQAPAFSAVGEVSLVGGGPGDPELITMKAVRLLQRADVVVYDRLISDAVLDLARRDAQKIYAGKTSSSHSMPQDEINDLLVKLARSGNRVVRLKGGDPFIFGRGGEEIGELMKHEISFSVVPGITAASGCSSYCGIPLTHRDHAQSVVFATGHLKNDAVELNWKSLAQPNQTVVIYMGLLALEIISRELVAHGQSPKTPVAVVQNGTLPDQTIVVGVLDDIAGKVEAAGLSSPALIVVGEVVRLREQLSWQ